MISVLYQTAGQPPRVTVQFDCDLDGIVHVSALDRGSGKQARTTVTAVRAHLSPAEIASTQAAAKTRRRLFFGLSCTVSSQSPDEASVRLSAMPAPQPPLHRNTKITGT